MGRVAVGHFDVATSCVSASWSVAVTQHSEQVLTVNLLEAGSLATRKRDHAPE